MASHSAAATPDDELPLALRYQVDASREVPCNLQAPFEILNKYGGQLKRHREPAQVKHLQREPRNRPSSEMGDNSSSYQELSAVSIMRMAKMELLQSNSQKTVAGFHSGLTHKQVKHLMHALYLLDAAEKFSNKRYEEAESLITPVLLASHADHPIERVITCFAQDLSERIDIKNGKFDLEREVVHVDVERALVDLKAAVHVSEQKLPFSQITHFTGIQTIFDSVASAARIHFVDVGTKLGSHWIIIMHALAERKNFPLEQLKITAVCTPKDNVEDTGRLLSSFAESMNLPFIFKLLYSEMYELKKDRFELEAGEVVVVNMEFCLLSLSASPKNIEALLGGLKSLNPHLMVVCEIEANTDESTFITRFHGALFLCSAMFDCLEDCLDRDNQCRQIIEKVYFQEIIKNGVMSENGGSFGQSCKIDFWREKFASFGIVETELSQPSVCQARLLIRESPCWSSCFVGMNGKCMLLGWNGIPIRSVSAWKLQHK